MADVNGPLQIEIRRQGRQVVRIVIHVHGRRQSDWTAVAAAVVGNDPIALMRKNSIWSSQSSLPESGQPWLNTMG